MLEVYVLPGAACRANPLRVRDTPRMFLDTAFALGIGRTSSRTPLLQTCLATYC